MSQYSIKLDSTKPYRYNFLATLFNIRKNKFENFETTVMIDTGCFNTMIDKRLLPNHCVPVKNLTLSIGIGGIKGVAQGYVLKKMKIGDVVLDNIVVFAFDFNGELRDHVLLGANVLNCWDFNLSRSDNTLTFTERTTALHTNTDNPYRYAFDGKGRVMAFQEIE